MITINIYYRGKNARAFAAEMLSSGTVEQIRAEDGNLRYEYFLPLDRDDVVLLIDSWQDQAAIDKYHASPMMRKITALREKYDLTMTVEKYVSAEIPVKDQKFIRK